MLDCSVISFKDTHPTRGVSSLNSIPWNNSRREQKKKSETNQILHVPFTITPTLLIIPDREISLQRAQTRETLVTPHSMNYWSVWSHVFSTGKSHWNTRKISDIQKIREIGHSLIFLWEVNYSRFIYRMKTILGRNKQHSGIHQ